MPTKLLEWGINFDSIETLRRWVGWTSYKITEKRLNNGYLTNNVHNQSTLTLLFKLSMDDKNKAVFELKECELNMGDTFFQ